MTAFADRARRGMTMVEMMVALTVFGIVVTSAMAMFRSQSRAFTAGNERVDALQNGLFAAELLERELRAAGSGTGDIQPFLVYAGADVLAFNADFVSNVANDVFAVYYDPNAPAGTVSALTFAQRGQIPNSAFFYPDTSYSGPGGVNSPAELIVFYFRPDSTTARTDDYVLLRQVNRAPAELVARNLLRNGSLPFFEYLRLTHPSGQPTTVTAVPAAQLPLAHTASIHLAPSDTGAFARIDSIRAVRLNVTATTGRTGAAERTRPVSKLLGLPNAGLATRRTCGDAPIYGGALVAGLGADASGQPVVNLAWTASVDEAGGERDVARYVLWRRQAGSPDWGDPYLSIPAGLPSYAYADAAVTSGDRYEYALAAQDCTPSLSSLATSGQVNIP